jgi:hypothetical protein
MQFEAALVVEMHAAATVCDVRRRAAETRTNGGANVFRRTATSPLCCGAIDKAAAAPTPTQQHNTPKQHDNTTQHNTTQHNTTQHNTTQHNTTQHNTTQHNTAQHNTTQHNTP